MDRELKTENFSELCGNELRALASSLGLSMSFAHLCLCRDHYKANAELGDPSCDELKVLDILAKHSKIAEPSLVSDLKFEDKEIADTLYDLYSKAKYLGDFKGSPLTIGEMVSILGRYFERIGVKAPTLPSKGDSFITLEDENKYPLATFCNEPVTKLPYGYVSEDELLNEKKVIIVKDTAFLLISKRTAEEAEEFNERLSKLTFSKVFKEKTILCQRLSENGILDTLLTFSKGLFIDLDHLPFEAGSKLSHLTASYDNTYLVAVRPELVNFVIKFISSHGLSVHFVAKKIAVNNILFHIDEKTQLFKNPFTNGFEAKNTLTVEKESFLPTEYKKICISSNGQSEKLEKNVLELPSLCLSPLLCETDNNAFSTSASAVIDNVLRLTAKGINRKEMGLKLTYGLPTEAEPKEAVSKLVASILGTYRAAIELCIADVDTKIAEISSQSSTLFSAAFTDKKPLPVPEHFLEVGSKVYIVSFKRHPEKSPSGIPDFDNLRKLCDYVCSLIKNGKVSSIRAFNGDPLSTINEMCSNSLELSGCNIQSILSQGFIIESRFELLGTPIGTLTKKTNDCEVTQ